VADLRLMSAPQIQAIHFPDHEHDGQRAATRARQRVLERLARERLLGRLERRIGGLRAGSASFVFAVGAVGQRLLAQDGARRRAYEPSWRFVDHTLTVSQLMVDLTLTQRAGQLELLIWQSEPRCWREFVSAGGRVLLRPDAFVSLGVADYELRWFVEVDRGSESIPTVLRKCRLYTGYYQSGREQAEQGGGVFPRICWLVCDEQRAKRIRRAIGRAGFPDGLFAVTTETKALAALPDELVNSERMTGEECGTLNNILARSIESRKGVIYDRK
jgi:hypothetical protein